MTSHRMAAARPQTALRKSEDRSLRSPPQVQALISFLEHDAQPMIVLDPDYNILAANTAYQRQFGTVDRPYLGQQVLPHFARLRRAVRSGRRTLPDEARVRAEGSGPSAAHPSHASRPRACGRRTAPDPRFAAPGSGVRRALGHRATCVGTAECRGTCWTRACLQCRVVGAAARGAVESAGAAARGIGHRQGAVRARRSRGERARRRALCRRRLLRDHRDALRERTVRLREGRLHRRRARKQGLVETSDGGTLFLDEIGDVPLPCR